LKEATVFPDATAVKELKAGGAKYVNRDVVIANRVVTARDPESAEKFAQAVAKLLSRK
jgi:putative intracellular protease/amidase